MECHGLPSSCTITWPLLLVTARCNLFATEKLSALGFAERAAPVPESTTLAFTREEPPLTPDAPAVQANITGYRHTHAIAYDEHPMSRLHMGEAAEAWVDVWRHALPPAPTDVLDVGTGTGQVALVLAELGHRVTGIDLAEGMMDLARAKSTTMANPPVLQVGDAVAPPFPPVGFDAVTSRYLLWTLREPQRALAAWRALLRPGGVLAAVDGNWLADGFKAENDVLDGSDGSEGSDGSDDAEFRRQYDDRVVSSLPLALARDMEAALALVGDAGFVDVHMAPLLEIERLERSLLEDPCEVRIQFLISARNPKTSRPRGGGC